MIRYVLIALLVILGVVVTQLPASFVTDRLPAGAALLTQPSGTLWRGAAQLQVDGRQLGQLNWSLRIPALLRLRASADLSLEGPDLALIGTAGLGLDRANRALEAQLSGDVGNELLNAVLSSYAIRINGDLALRAVTLTAELQDSLATMTSLEDVITFTSLSGELAWEGGLATYTLQAGASTTSFPALSGILSLSAEQLPQLAVYSPGIEFALLRLNLLPGGFVKVGVSKRFTALAGMPWPGQEPDDAIVLEVEQQVF